MGRKILIHWITLSLCCFVLAEIEVPVTELGVEHRGGDCNCMDYWQCVSREGTPYSYCGLNESSVCCIIKETQPISKAKCGVKGFDSGKVDVAEPSEWPWHVAVIEDPGLYYVCGGSLIDEGWVMTAAHCVKPYINNDTVKLKVRLGEYDVSATSESLEHHDSQVSAIVLHPEFDSTTLLADIALLRLESPAVQGPHIDVVCLPHTDQRIASLKSCILTGWGQSTESGNYSQILKELSIPLWRNADCEFSLKREFGSNFELSNRTFCAGASGRDACDGDGGGPLVCEEDGQWKFKLSVPTGSPFHPRLICKICFNIIDNWDEIGEVREANFRVKSLLQDTSQKHFSFQWFQHGIVSYGFGCGRRGVPGVYTRVASFYKWIENTVLSSPGAL